MQSHTAMHPDNGHEHHLFGPEVRAELPVEQDQARVRVGKSEPGMRQTGANDMRNE
jgi:hypothetical protein